MIADLLKYVIHNVWNRKLRSLLTVISVVIGIAAITTLVSFGYGISSYVDTIAQQMGNDKLIVQPRGFGFGPALESNVRLNDDDRDAIESVHGVAEAAGVYYMSAAVDVGKKEKFSAAWGMDFADHAALMDEVYNLKIVAGSSLRGKEKNKVVLGYNYLLKDKVFPQPVSVRNKVVVNNVSFEVAGFYQEVGNPEDDRNVYMTKAAAEDVFGLKSYQFIVVRAAPDVVPEKLADTIREELLDTRHQKRGSEDFFVQTFEQVIATFTSVLSIVTTVVVLIAFISLIVASVNIMNTMYTAILERTKEIGVFKAVGAPNRVVVLVFVAEAALLSLLGGIIGTLIGFIVASFAGRVVSAAGYAVFSPLFTWQLAVGTLVFSLLIGVVAGVVPAYQASKLKPVDALRYE